MIPKPLRPLLYLAASAAVAGLLASKLSLSAGTPSWISKVILRVSEHEGGPAAVNPNTDGAGLSFGILQWAQKPGSLGVLLSAMYSQDPALFRSVFGSHSQELLSRTRAGSLAPIGGSLLWEPSWISRFRTAGREPTFIAVQNRLAAEGEYFQAALKSASILGIKTERSVALFFDTAVQQGPAFALRLARSIASEGGNLADYARRAPAHFRRTTPPTADYPSSRIEWRQTGMEWHAWAGAFDLYEDVRRRRAGILRDPNLSDSQLKG